MSDDQRCLICGLAAQSFQDKIQEDMYEVNCYKCGRYSISQSDSVSIGKYFPDERRRANLSGWVRENQPHAIIRYNEFEKLSDLKAPPVGERATNLLLYIARKFPNIGSTFSRNRIYQCIQALESPRPPEEKGFDKDETSILVPMLSVSWSLDWNELEYLLHDYLWKGNGYIDTSTSNNVKITPQGWSFIDELTRGSLDSHIAFIAMQFDDDLKDYSEKWVEAAIFEAGYEPKRVDSEPHTNLIDNEIIAMLRRCRFVVADLTRSNLGVYYEAGFGHGLGRRVIFLCEKKLFKEKGVHFDTNHYPVLRWEWDKGEELKTELRHWVERIFGRGNYKPSS